MLKKYIKSSTFLYIVFILIVEKSDKAFCTYVNYKTFNAFTIFNRNILLLIKKIFAKLYAINIYNKFDIIIIFNKIKIKKNYEKKIVFLIKYNLYEYIIMLFELYNALTTFQIFIINIFKK